MKHYYLIVDTETTSQNTVADFGAVIVDRQGVIHEQFGVLIDGHFGTLPLFSDHRAPAEAFFSTQMLHRRRKHYDQLLANGQRSLCSASLVNLWLARVLGQYDPVLTAYNLSFDFGKCANTDIDLGIFSQRFCLMKAAKRQIGTLAEYHDFCHDNRFLTLALRKPSMTADTMAKFILGVSLEDEPHTALEDAQFYEAPILTKILESVTRKQLLELGR